MTSRYDWTRFERQIFIQADKAYVWRAWVVPQNLEKWFIATADYTAEDSTHRPADAVIEVGDCYHWAWHQELSTNGRVLELVENEKLTFTFGEGQTEMVETIVVTVEMTEEEDGVTRLRLVQENMPDSPEAHVSWHLGCNMGWSFFMTNLKGLLEYGIDLRETDAERAYASRAISH